jgi:hypothetical protein
MTDMIKRLDEIGREEGGVHDVTALDREKEETQRKRELDKYFIATKIMRPFEDPMGYFKKAVGGVIDRISGVVGQVYPGRARCGTNDLDEE